MADTNNTNNNENKNILIGGVTTTEIPDYTVDDLAPNNYLTIVWHNAEGQQFNSLDIDDKSAVKYTTDLSSALERGINNNSVQYIGQSKYINLETLGKYISQNVIPASSKRTIVNAFISLLSGSRDTLGNEVINLIVNVFGGIVDKTAKNLGLTDPHELFASFANENVIKLFTELGNQTKDFIEEKISNFANKNIGTTFSKTEEKSDKKYVGLLLGLTTSDTESYDITIPRKKVEDGSDYTTHLLPQPFKKDFNVILTNKILSSDFNRVTEIENIEKVKDKLIEIANSKIPFDIYIRLSNTKCYKRSNVYFSSISFTKDENSGDTYTCSFSIEPIRNFKTKTFISNRKYFPKPSKRGYDESSLTKGSSSGYSNSSSGKNAKIGEQSSTGNKFKIAWDNKSDNTKLSKTFIGLKSVELTYSDIMRHAANNGYLVEHVMPSNTYVFIRPGRIRRTKSDVLCLNEHYDSGTYIPYGGYIASGKNKLGLVKGLTLIGGYISNGKSSYKIIIPPNSTVRGLIR